MTPPSEMLVSQAALVAELMDAALDQRLRAHGIGHRTFELLSAIKAAGGKTPQAEIAHRLGIKPPSFTEAVRPLIASGLVEQNLVEGDQRARHLSLTPEGERMVTLALKEIAVIDRTIGTELDQNQLKVTLGTLRKASRILARLTAESNV
jgi:DNA-binding MarR family transcriptional regulator